MDATNFDKIYTKFRLHFLNLRSPNEFGLFIKTATLQPPPLKSISGIKYNHNWILYQNNRLQVTSGLKAITHKQLKISMKFLVDGKNDDVFGLTLTNQLMALNYIRASAENDRFCYGYGGEFGFTTRGSPFITLAGKISENNKTLMGIIGTRRHFYLNFSFTNQLFKNCYGFIDLISIHNYNGLLLSTGINITLLPLEYKFEIDTNLNVKCGLQFKRKNLPFNYFLTLKGMYNLTSGRFKIYFGGIQ